MLDLATIMNIDPVAAERGSKAIAAAWDFMHLDFGPEGDGPTTTIVRNLLTYIDELHRGAMTEAQWREHCYQPAPGHGEGGS